jgi:holin-like protein
MDHVGIRYPVIAAGLLALIGLSAGGNLLAGALHVPLPGPVLAGVALVCWLARRPQDVAFFGSADRLIAVMPLLFVPLVVGAAASLSVLGSALTPFVLTLIASTLAALIATVAVARLTTWLCSRSR